MRVRILCQAGRSRLAERIHFFDDGNLLFYALLRGMLPFDGGHLIHHALELKGSMRTEFFPGCPSEESIFR